MSAHHYFYDFFSCDSGMIPWLLMAQLVGASDLSLSALVADAQKAFPCSGEINFRVKDASAIITKLEGLFDGKADKVEIDGITYEFDDWRFNVRMSNTEPLLRLNVETRGDSGLLAEKTQMLQAVIES